MIFFYQAMWTIIQYSQIKFYSVCRCMRVIHQWVMVGCSVSLESARNQDYLESQIELVFRHLPQQHFY